MENNQDLLQQTYQLAKENNRMLHAMRRHAFFSGLIKLVVYAALLILPFWLYLQYLSPQVDRMLNIMKQIQGTGNQAQQQITDITKTWEGLKSKIPGMSSSTTN